MLTEQYGAALRGESRSFDFHSSLTESELAIRAAPLLRGRGDRRLPGDLAGRDRSNAAPSASSLAEERRRYLILDAMNEAYVANDMDGRVTAWNRAAETMFGWSADEAIGKQGGRPDHPGSGSRQFTEVMSRQAPGAPAEGRYDVRAERIVIHRGGHEFTVELAASMVEIDGESTLHSLMHDISDRKRAEARAPQPRIRRRAPHRRGRRARSQHRRP